MRYTFAPNAACHAIITAECLTDVIVLYAGRVSRPSSVVARTALNVSLSCDVKRTAGVYFVKMPM